MKNLSKKKGFTLIEVILAITILSTLSVLIATSLSRALKAKRKIQAEVEDVSSLRDAVKVIRADVYQAYNHYDFEKEIFDVATKPAAPTTAVAGGIPAQAPERKTPRIDPATHFSGEAEKLGFVTLNNGRFLANEIQADFIEVGYALKPCRNLTKETSSQCLYRRVQKLTDDDVTEGGTESVLLENVKQFKLRYIGEGKKEWVDSWKTIGGQDDTTKNIFPDAVEVTLLIERELDTKKREYSLDYVIPLHFPNNVKAKTNSATKAK